MVSTICPLKWPTCLGKILQPLRHNLHKTRFTNLVCTAVVSSYSNARRAPFPFVCVRKSSPHRWTTEVNLALFAVLCVRLDPCRLPIYHSIPIRVVTDAWNILEHRAEEMHWLTTSYPPRPLSNFQVCQSEGCVCFEGLGCAVESPMGGFRPCGEFDRCAGLILLSIPRTRLLFVVTV